MDDRNIFVIIPAYNEEKHIGEVVRKTYDILPKARIIVIDDGSTDKTRIKAMESHVIMLAHPVNFGKGRSITDAWFYLLNAFTPRADDIIIQMDSDGQHEPESILELIDKLEATGKNQVDMVVGRRDLSVYPFYKKFGNKFLSWMATILSGQWIQDSESGFRAFPVYVLLDLVKTVNPQRYELEMEINVATALLGHKIGFISIKSPKYRHGVGIRSGVKSAYAGVKTWIKIKSGWLKWQ